MYVILDRPAELKALMSKIINPTTLKLNAEHFISNFRNIIKSISGKYAIQFQNLGKYYHLIILLTKLHQTYYSSDIGSLPFFTIKDLNTLYSESEI